MMDSQAGHATNRIREPRLELLFAPSEATQILGRESATSGVAQCGGSVTGSRGCLNKLSQHYRFAKAHYGVGNRFCVVVFAMTVALKRPLLRKNLLFRCMTVILCAVVAGILAVGRDIVFGRSPGNVTAGQYRVWTARIFFIGVVMATASMVAIELYQSLPTIRM